jgi:hypothetical protein
MKLNKNQFFTPKAPKPPSGVSGNELDEMTGPISKEGRDHEGADPELAKEARQTFF